MLLGERYSVLRNPVVLRHERVMARHEGFVLAAERAEIRRRRIRVCSSGGQTADRKPPGEQLRQRARVDLVGLRTRARDPFDRLRIRQHHPAHSSAASST